MLIPVTQHMMSTWMHRQSTHLVPTQHRREAVYITISISRVISGESQANAIIRAAVSGTVMLTEIKCAAGCCELGSNSLAACFLIERGRLALPNIFCRCLVQPQLGITVDTVAQQKRSMRMGHHSIACADVYQLQSVYQKRSIKFNIGAYLLSRH